MDSSHIHEIAPDIFMWRARHPQWNSDVERVACYAVRSPGGLAVFDPLIEDDRQLHALRELEFFGSAAVFITIPYHVRSADLVAEELGAPIIGHTAVGDRLLGEHEFIDATAREHLPLGVRAVRIGNPKRNETPFFVPHARALVLGDVAIGGADGLRLWEEVDERRRSWFERRFLPSLEPLLDLDVERVLPTHGLPVISGGHAALEAMIDAPPAPRIRDVLSGDALA